MDFIKLKNPKLDVSEILQLIESMTIFKVSVSFNLDGMLEHWNIGIMVKIA